jgi:hypothetical protein
MSLGRYRMLEINVFHPGIVDMDYTEELKTTVFLPMTSRGKEKPSLRHLCSMIYNRDMGGTLLGSVSYSRICYV